MKAKHHHLTAAACIAAALTVGIVLAACTDDARTPGNAPGTTTPLILNATVAAPTASPASRANTAASQWTDGDEVAVEVGGIAKRYIVKTTAGATATLSPADAANTHFWPGLNQPVIVRAWRYGDGYRGSMLTDWSVFTTQSATDNGESYYQQSDFLYAPAKSVSYDAASGAGLTFYHQTARMVVKIRQAGLVTDASKENMQVSIGNAGPAGNTMLLKGRFDASRIDPTAGEYSGLTADETTVKRSIGPNPIPTASALTGYARCYEALVIPQDMRGKHLICVGIDNKWYYYTPAPDDDHANLRGGYTYTYDIIVSEHGRLDVTVSTSPIAEWFDRDLGEDEMAYHELINLSYPPTAINDDRVYMMRGTNIHVTTINITGGSPTLILRDLDYDGCIRITGGTPEIRVVGTNNNIRNNGNPPIWLDGDDANVRITGQGVTESRLALTNVNLNAVIGTGGSESKSDLRCGNISISNLTLSATTDASGTVFGGAVIGTGGGGGSRKCGNITITDATILATPGKGAASIGFGSSTGINMQGSIYEMGDITIRNSTIESTIKQGWTLAYPAHIGSGVATAETYKVGTITIDTDKSATEFFAKFDGGRKSGAEVIVGFPGMARPWLVNWNGTEYPEIYWGRVPGLP